MGLLARTACYKIGPRSVWGDRTEKAEMCLDVNRTKRTEFGPVSSSTKKNCGVTLSSWGTAVNDTNKMNEKRNRVTVRKPLHVQANLSNGLRA